MLLLAANTVQIKFRLVIAFPWKLRLLSFLSLDSGLDRNSKLSLLKLLCLKHKDVKLGVL